MLNHISTKKSSMTTGLHHNVRPELQGLRGWAVIAVVVFHFFPAILPYGYLGVDVFFVLSGFLIALVLDRPPSFLLETYKTFYFRRIRRIFPLLLLVVEFILVYVVLNHYHNRLYYSARSILYALAFSTNLKAHDEGETYFMMLEKANDPLTHTWSLGVEIQFYCIAPVIFCLGKKLFGERGWPLVPYLLLLSSFSFCFQAVADSSTAFNSLLARLWQFLLGSAIFQIQNPPNTYLSLPVDDSPIEKDSYRVKKDKCITITLCIVLSYASYYFYEQWYQSLSKSATFTLIGFLYFLALLLTTITKGTPISTALSEYYSTCSHETTVLLNSLLSEDSDLDKSWRAEMHRNLSISETQTINLAYDLQNLKNIQLDCEKFSGQENPWGMCQSKKGLGSLRFFSFGNSFNANLGGLIQKHFRHLYSDLDFFTMIGCMAVNEPQFIGKCHGERYMEEVQKHTHDVVFVVQRYGIKNGTNSEPPARIEEDSRMLNMLNYVEEYGKNAKKIFVMQALPLPQEQPEGTPCKAANHNCLTGLIVNDAASDRMRLEEIAKRCSKCVVFDVKQRHMDKDGNFKIFHPHTHIEFFENNLHYTPYGLRLIEPVFKKMAQQFPQLLESKYPNNIFKVEDSGVVD